MKNSLDTFEKVTAVTMSNDVKYALDSLEALDNVFSIFDQDKCETFYRSIESISKKSFFVTEKRVNIESLQTAKWALELWDNATKAEKLDRMFIAYLILDYLGYPVDTLPIIWNNEKRKEISLITEGFNVNIGVPENADYSHQSQFRQYREGVTGKELGKLLEFFSALEMGIGINGRNPILPKWIQLIDRIHEDGITALLSKGEPAIAELVIQSLQSDEIATILAEYYKSEHEFPLARGFVVLAMHFEKELERDKMAEIPYEKLGVIFSKLAKFKNWDAIFSTLHGIGPIRWNSVFHYCCGSLAANSQSFISKYLETLDFSLEENDYGSAFYKALFNSGNEDVISHASELVSSKYFDYLKNRSGQYVLNRGTGYFNFIAFYVQTKANDVDGYRKLLADYFERVETALVSWFPNQTSFHLQVFYLVLAANFTLGFELKVDEPIVQKIKSFIQDERHSHLLSDLPPDSLIALMTNPSEIETLTAVYDNGSKVDLRRNSPKSGDTQ